MADTSISKTPSKANNASSKIDDTASAAETTPITVKRTWGQWAIANWGKLLALVVLIGLAIFIAIDTLTTKHVSNGITTFLEWVGDNPTAGFFVFLIVYMFATIAFIPGSILTLGSGFAFVSALGAGPGLAAAIGAVVIGAFCGAQIAFFGGRFVFTDAVKGLSAKFPVLKAIDKVFETEGLKLNFLLRLSPVVPFSAFNYIMGGTSSTWRDFAIGTLGIVPGTVLYCYIGAIPALATGGDDSQDSTQQTVNYIIYAVGGVATIVAVVLVTIYAKRSLAKTIADQEAAERGELDNEGKSGGDLEEGNCVGKKTVPMESYACEDYGQVAPVVDPCDKHMMNKDEANNNSSNNYDDFTSPATNQADAKIEKFVETEL